MRASLAERHTAIEAADGTCPRCGAGRERGHRYCLECGLHLPVVTGTVPKLRRVWLRRVGWYPGDWVWVSLLMLLIAAAGAAGSIALTEARASGDNPVFTAAATVPVVEPIAVPTATTPPRGDTTTLPTAPEPTTAAPGSKRAGRPNGRRLWPANENGWTIVLVSYPKTSGRASALATASKAARAGLHQVGILDSNGFASLQPGYLVVFTGIYGSKEDADASVSTTRQAGFAGAYSRQIAR